MKIVKNLFAKRNKDKKFSQLYNEHHDFLYSVALKLTCKDQELALDILQESLSKAYNAFDRFDGQNPRAWLKTILRNTYFDYYKKQKKEKQSRSYSDFDDVVRTQAAQPERDFTVEEFEALLHALEHNSDSDQWIEPMKRLVDDELIEALKTIPGKYRAALLLQHVTELSYEEIAETMNCKMGTVMSRLSRAREALKDALMQQNKSIGQKLRSIENQKSRTSGHIVTNTSSSEKELSMKKEAG